MKKIIIAIALFIAGAASSQLDAQCVRTGIKAHQVQQHHRIKHGVISGELTRKEAARLRAQQAKIHHDKRLAKADGVVTPYERAYIKREQKRASKNIYVQKHDTQNR